MIFSDLVSESYTNLSSSRKSFWAKLEILPKLLLKKYLADPFALILPIFAVIFPL